MYGHHGRPVFYPVGTSTLADQRGHVHRIVTYVFNFTFSFDDVPFLIQQIARLRDIGSRMNLPKVISEIDEDDRA